MRLWRQTNPDGGLADGGFRFFAGGRGCGSKQRFSPDSSRLAAEIKDWAEREYKENTKLVRYQKQTGLADDHAFGGSGGFKKKSIGELNKARRARRIKEFERLIDEQQDQLAMAQSIGREEFTEEFIARRERRGVDVDIRISKDFLEGMREQVPKLPDE